MSIREFITALLFLCGVVIAGVEHGHAHGYLVQSKHTSGAYHQFAVTNFPTFETARAEAQAICIRDNLNCYLFEPLLNSCAAVATNWNQQGPRKIGAATSDALGFAKAKAQRECGGACAMVLEVCDKSPAAGDEPKPLLTTPPGNTQPILYNPEAKPTETNPKTTASIITDDRRYANERVLLTAEAERQRQSKAAREQKDIEAQEATTPIYTAIKKTIPKLVTLVLPFFFVFYGFAVRYGQPKQPPRISWVGTAVSLFVFGILVSLAAEFALGIDVWRSSISTFEGAVATALLLTLVWFLTGRFRKGRRFVDYLFAPFSVLADIKAFIRGTFFLFSRHPAEKVIIPALHTGQPIDGPALVRATSSDPDASLAGKLRSWAQMMRGRKLAERTEAAAAQTEAERDIHLAAHKLETLRGEEEAARQAYEALKRKARERKKP